MNATQKTMKNLRTSDAKKLRKQAGLWWLCDKTIHHTKDKVCFVLDIHKHDLLHDKVPKDYIEEGKNVSRI